MADATRHPDIISGGATHMHADTSVSSDEEDYGFEYSDNLPSTDDETDGPTAAPKKQPSTLQTQASSSSLLVTSDDVLQHVASVLTESAALGATDAASDALVANLVEALSIGEREVKVPMQAKMPPASQLVEHLVRIVWRLCGIAAVETGQTRRRPNVQAEVRVALGLGAAGRASDQVPLVEHPEVVASVCATLPGAHLGVEHALRDAVRDALRASLTDRVALVAAQVRNLRALSLSCRSLRELLRPRIILLAGRAMRLLVGKLTPCVDRASAARLGHMRVICRGSPSSV